MPEAEERSARLSPWWRHAAILVMVAGFSVLSVVTVLTYTNAPPIPARVAGEDGRTLFDDAAILHGQEVFLRHGLMEHGTLWGHGAYLGPAGLHGRVPAPSGRNLCGPLRPGAHGTAARRARCGRGGRCGRPKSGPAQAEPFRSGERHADLHGL
jgi:hypothetical protein